MKLLALKNPRSTRRKYCKYRFKEETETEELSIALCNRYTKLWSVDQMVKRTDGMEQECRKIKKTICLSTCEEALGKANKIIINNQEVAR